MMLIIALLASLVVTLTPGTGRAQLKAVSLETAALLRRERLDAILTGRARQVSIDNKQRALVGDGRDLVLIPRDVVLDVLGVRRTLVGTWIGRALRARRRFYGSRSQTVARKGGI